MNKRSRERLKSKNLSDLFSSPEATYENEIVQVLPDGSIGLLSLEDMIDATNRIGSHSSFVGNLRYVLETYNYFLLQKLIKSCNMLVGRLKQSSVPLRSGLFCGWPFITDFSNQLVLIFAENMGNFGFSHLLVTLKKGRSLKSDDNSDVDFWNFSLCQSLGYCMNMYVQEKYKAT